MEVDVRELGGSRVRLHVRLEAAEVDQAFDQMYQELAQRGGIRGFRPGRIPRGILDRHYDPEAIRTATYEKLLEDRLREVCEQAELQPMEQVQIEVGPPPDDEDEEIAASIKAKLTVDEAEAEQEQPAEEAEQEGGEEEDAETPRETAENQVLLAEGQPFEFYTTFTTYPRPKLPEYHGLKLKRPVAEVTDEEIGAQLKRLREVNAREAEVDRSTVGEGDLVVVDIAIEMAEEDADENSQVQEQERELIIGQGEYEPPIDRELIGHVVGQTVELPVEYPEDHPDPELAGKHSAMQVTIKSLKGRELPELNDEFAREIGDYESLQDLHESIRSQLEQAQADYANQELRRQALRHILDNMEVELPGMLVERAAERSFESFVAEVEQAGVSLAGLTEATGMDEDTLRANQRMRAEAALKLHFALQAVADREKIEATAEDIEQEIQRYAADSGGAVEFVREAAEVQPDFADELQDRAIKRKLIDAIVAAAEIEEVARERYEAEEGDGQQEQADEDKDAQEPRDCGEQESEEN